MREYHMDRPTTKEVARFISKINITKSCWGWESVITIYGYGHFRYRDKMVRAHRFSYALFVGHIPDEMQILHKCNNRKCVNPVHLYLGTHQQNMDDRKKAGDNAIGIKNASAKLSNKDVFIIRSLHSDKKYGYKNTAEIFGISSTQVGNIVKGINWSHLLSSEEC